MYCGLLALRVIEYRQLAQILAIFLLVQFAGLLLATQIFTGAVSIQIQSVQIATTSYNALFYIAYIIVVTAVLLIIFKIYKGDKLFVILEGGVIFLASFIMFLIAISAVQGNALAGVYGNVSPLVIAAAAGLALILVIAKWKNPRLRNLTAIIASIGTGIILGVTFNFAAALVFMAVLAVYDFIAVFVTKHMVALGNMAVEKNLSFLVMVNEIEAVPERLLTKAQKKEFEKSKHEIGKQGSFLKSLVHQNMVPMAARTALGTGDLATPLMLAIAAYKVNLNFILSFVVIVGAALGLVLTMVILRRYKRALPAIPPLLFGIGVALIAYRAVTIFIH